MSLVVGRSQEDEDLIQALALAVQQPQRKLFTLLTWDSTIAKVCLVWFKFILFIVFTLLWTCISSNGLHRFKIMFRLNVTFLPFSII